MDYKKFISLLLVISLLVPSFIVLGSNAPLYAYNDDQARLRSNISSILKGIAMFFVLNRIVRGGEDTDSSSTEDTSLEEDMGDEDPIEEEDPVEEEPGSDDDDGFVEEPIEDEDLSNDDWTEIEATALTTQEEEMLYLVNQERSSRGLEPLEVDLRLLKVARAKSNNMIEEEYFGHQSPTLGSPFDMMKELDIYYEFAGENIAGAPTVVRAHEALMDSPGHKENILRPRFTHVGIGIIEGGPYGIMFSQEFIDLGRFAN